LYRFVNQLSDACVLKAGDDLSPFDERGCKGEPNDEERAMADDANAWALIRAAGEGTRLKSLTTSPSARRSRSILLAAARTIATARGSVVDINTLCPTLRNYLSSPAIVTPVEYLRPVRKAQPIRDVPPDGPRDDLVLVPAVPKHRVSVALTGHPILIPGPYLLPASVPATDSATLTPTSLGVLSCA
jgi:hypothetical protein